MESFILRENVLSDNILLKAPENKVFKGGFIAIIKEYVFQNSWCDREIIKKFRNRERLEKYLSKNYPDFDYYA